MAEPLSIITSTVIIVEIIHKSISIFNAVRSAHDTLGDPKFIAAQADLFLEQSRLALWTQYVQGQPGGWEAVSAHMNQNQVKALDDFQKQAEFLLGKAESLFDRGDPREKNGTRRIRASLFWATRGEDLTTVLNAIHKVNNALEKIIEPPPGYYGSLPTPSSSQGRPTPQIAPPSTTENRCEENVEPADNQEDTVASQPRFRIIHHLFRHSVMALDKIENYDQQKPIVFSSTKLRRWGEVLDEPPVLDTLLSLEAGGELVYAELRQTIITAFVDIILIEESILTELVEDRSRPDLGQTLLELVASLAAGDVIGTAVNKAGPIYEHSDGGELIAKGLVDLNQCINDLYQLLPTIRMIRRGAQLEATKKTQTPAQPTGVTEQLIQTVQDIVQSSGNAQSDEPVESSKVGSWQKELERLREYRQSQAGKLRGADRAIANAILRKFIQDHEKKKGKQTEPTEADVGDGINKEQYTKLSERVSEMIGNLPRPGNHSAEG
ncbi:hypothetical protein ANO14919_001850 [Xylariales sp. No.14919]|nr:hypothetical protein ANO14919_001850 [Xylariales sp. No.14919]